MIASTAAWTVLVTKQAGYTLNVGDEASAFRRV
jgi:hypothetical protein